MQRIVPHFWFDHNAQEAAEFYVSVFNDSKINAKSYYPKTAEEGLADFQQDLAGKVLTVDFELSGYHFIAINADTTFKPNPSISFFYTCDTKGEMDMLWGKLARDGKTLMELGEYPFSKYYGWIQDKFGYCWQLILNNPAGDKRPKIVPSFMFTQEKTGKAEEAIVFYTSIFKNSKVGNLSHYEQDIEMSKKGTLAYGDFQLENQWFAAMDGGIKHDFTFTPAISLMVLCNDQAEINHYWEKLSANPEFEQCGWLQDKYGVSWQITPENIEELLKKPGAFKRMMNMKKLDIQQLQEG